MHDFVRDLPRPWKRRLLLGHDVVLAPISLLLAFGLREEALWPIDPALPSWPYFLFLTALAGVTSTVLGLPGIRLIAYEARAMMRTGALALVLVVCGALTNAWLGSGLSTALFVSFGFLYFGLSVVSRIIGLNLLLWIYRQGTERTRVLIYGAGSTGSQLVAALSQTKDIEPVAFVDDNPSLHGAMVAGLKVLAPRKIAEFVREHRIDRVVLAMPSLSLPRQARIALRLENLGCDVHRVPSFSELVGNKGLVANIEPVHPADLLGRGTLDGALPEVVKSYRDKVVLVTGAGGSIGSELCRQLLAGQPRALILFDHSEPALYSIDMEMQTLAEGRGVEIVPVIGSVNDSGALLRVMIEHKVQIVFHAAAHKHVPLVERNEIEGLRNNVLGTRKAVEAAQGAGVERFVLISSDKAVRPTNIMGASKRMAELIVQDMATRSKKTIFSIVRFGNVLGSSGSVIPLFQEQIARGGPVTLTHNDVRRYFMTASEAARLVLLAGSYSRGGDVFVLDMGKPIPIRRLARQLIEREGYTVKDRKNPDGDIEIIVTGMRPGEKMVEELLIGNDLRPTPHPKILRARETGLSEIEVASMLQALGRLVDEGDAEKARALVAHWVSGYHQPDYSGQGVDAG